MQAYYEVELVPDKYNSLPRTWIYFGTGPQKTPKPNLQLISRLSNQDNDLLQSLSKTM